MAAGPRKLWKNWGKMRKWGSIGEKWPKIGGKLGEKWGKLERGGGNGEKWGQNGDESGEEAKIGVIEINGQN